MSTEVENIAKTVTDLNAGWYNVVARALNLEPATFLLAQGTLGLQADDSSGLFLMSDAVVPSASVAYFDPSGLSKRSDSYRMLLNAVLPESASDLPAVLGDQYAQWLAYRNAWYDNNPTSLLTQEALFSQWARQRLDPGKASRAITVYKQQVSTPLSRALDAMTDPASTQQFSRSDGTLYRLYAYSATVDAARHALETGGTVDIDFDSRTMEKKLTNLTVQGSATGRHSLFSATGSGVFDRLDQRAASSAWTVKGHIGQYATLSTNPVNWFHSDEFMRAYNNKGYDVWDPHASAGNWDSFFSQSTGSLARRLSELVLVSDYDITVTSHTTYEESEVQKIAADAKVGVWPFFSASASGSHKTEFNRNNDGTMSVNYKLGRGLVQIWGVTYQKAPN
jgi:hypothetical protein